MTSFGHPLIDQSNKPLEPELSALILNYNHATLLPRALDSVLNQRLKPLEIVIIDDCSNDNSVEVARQYQQLYPHIRLHRNESNLGGHQCKKIIHPTLKGKWVATVCADDWMEPDYFDKGMAMARQYPDIAIVFGQMRMVSADGVPINTFGASSWNEPTYVSPKDYLERFLLVESATHSLSGSTMVRNDLFCELGGFLSNDDIVYDTLTYWVLALTHGACYTPHPFLCWRKHQGSVSVANQAEPHRVIKHVDGAVNIMLERYPDLFPLHFVSSWASAWAEHRLTNQVRQTKRNLKPDSADFRAFAEKLYLATHTFPGSRYMPAETSRKLMELLGVSVQASPEMGDDLQLAR